MVMVVINFMFHLNLKFLNFLQLLFLILHLHQILKNHLKLILHYLLHDNAFMDEILHLHFFYYYLAIKIIKFNLLYILVLTILLIMYYKRI